MGYVLVLIIVFGLLGFYLGYEYHPDCMIEKEVIVIDEMSYGNLTYADYDHSTNTVKYTDSSIPIYTKK